MELDKRKIVTIMSGSGLRAMFCVGWETTSAQPEPILEAAPSSHSNISGLGALIRKQLYVLPPS